MEIVLLCMLVPLPNTSREIGHPVVRGLALAVDIASRPPDVPISFRVIFRGPRFFKPFVLMFR
jgi:hypothetical protein